MSPVGMPVDANANAAFVFGSVLLVEAAAAAETTEAAGCGVDSEGDGL